MATHWIKTLAVVLVLSVCLIGARYGATQSVAVSRTLRTLTTANAGISKMDWLILNAKVDVLRSSPPKAPFGQPDYSFDRDHDRIAVYIDVWKPSMEQKSLADLKKTFVDEAELRCGQFFLADEQLKTWDRNDWNKHCVVFFLDLKESIDKHRARGTDIMVQFEDGKLGLQ